MGEVQSTLRGSRQDAAAAEESREEDNPQAEQDTEHKVGPRTRTAVFHSHAVVRNLSAEVAGAASRLIH